MLRLYLFKMVELAANQLEMSKRFNFYLIFYSSSDRLVYMELRHLCKTGLKELRVGAHCCSRDLISGNGVGGETAPLHTLSELRLHQGPPQ